MDLEFCHELVSQMWKKSSVEIFHCEVSLYRHHSKFSLLWTEGVQMNYSFVGKSTAVCGLGGVFHNMSKCQTGLDLLYKFGWFPSLSSSMYDTLWRLWGAIFTLFLPFPLVSWKEGQREGEKTAHLLCCQSSMFMDTLRFLIICKNTFKGSHMYGIGLKMYHLT